MYEMQNCPHTLFGMNFDIKTEVKGDFQHFMMASDDEEDLLDRVYIYI